MSRRNMLLLTVTAMVSYLCYVRGEQNPYARYVAGGYSIIDRWALQDTPDQELFEGAMQGMVSVLQKRGDEHSLFINEEQRDIFREELTQEFGGIGVRIRQLGDPPQLTIVGPPEPGTPAFDADIRSGDRIVALDGKPTANMEMIEVLKIMRGTAGQQVVLSITHQGEETVHEIALTRAVITVESIRGDLRQPDGTWLFQLESDLRIGYLRITSFGDKTEEELAKALDLLCGPAAKNRVEALILDVRDNYGGALDAAVGISDLFLRAGLPIVSTRGRDQVTRDRFVSTGSGGYTTQPLAILINHNSASAAEILAACLQDYNRAVVIGQRSFGKGTVQRLVRIESGRSLLKLTSATYWRPSGKNIHRMPGDSDTDPWGVSPNEGFQVVLDDKEYLEWRHYRRRRDLIGNSDQSPLAMQIDKEDGKPPESYVDRAFEKARDYLAATLDQ
ncbi:MAG: S41 family peptidase [Planctomycetales bacterium]|nr:S41 family peptidase [Planctomycetales bacterium]